MNRADFTPDSLDPMLSEFFRSRMPSPWPTAPIPASRMVEAAGPGHSLATPPQLPRSRPQPGSWANSRANSRAKLTLFASLALVLATGWYLSEGIPVGANRSGIPATGGENVLPASTATTPAEFQSDPQEKARKAKDPMTGFQPGTISLP